MAPPPQLKKISARRKLCLEDDKVSNTDSTQEAYTSLRPIEKNRLIKGYKLRGPSSVKYYDESDNNTEDYSPDCSEYIPSPERCTSSLGGDSFVMENFLNNASRPPSRISNLSSILGETDFVASPDIVYINTPKQGKKHLISSEASNKENTPLNLVDISLKPPKDYITPECTKEGIENDSDKTLTLCDLSPSTTMTSSLVNEKNFKKKNEFTIEIYIEAESPERCTEIKLDKSEQCSVENHINEENNNEASLFDSNFSSKVINESHKETQVFEKVTYLQEMEDNNKEKRNQVTPTIDPLDINNQSPEEDIQELVQLRQQETPIQFIPEDAFAVDDTYNVVTINQEIDSTDRLSPPNLAESSRALAPSQNLLVTSAVNEIVTTVNNQPSEISDSESDNDNTKKLTRKRKRNEDNWIDNKNKRLKNSGEEYIGARNKKKHQKKTILSSCKCKKGCGTKFTNEQRQAIHSRFYSFASREYQWQYIARHVKAEEVKRITVNRKCNRTQTIKYYLPLDKEEIQVCKIFFLNTLSITEQMIYTALDKIKSDESLIDKRGLHSNRPHRMKLSTEESVKTHIRKFPRVKPHYTRKNSKRKYLDENLNISKMFRLYKNWFCEQNYSEEVKIATKRQYEKVFNTQFNLSFYKPKKDQCTLCSQYKNADAAGKAALEEEYRKHIVMKDRVREIKNEEKNTLDKDNCVMAIFDLQKVLSVPRSEVSIFHYKRKYPVYNFTVFDALNKKGFCYVWHAAIGRKGSVEIGSCLLQFIQTLYDKGIRKIIFYSDGCYGQNKNRYIFALYLYIAIKLKLDITHRFFVGGHSQNEGDSMHACIEKALKYKVVYTPDQLYNIILNAKVSGEKYDLKEMQQTEIFNIKELVEPKRWEHDKNGEKVRWSDVMEVRVSHLQPNTFLFKYNYDEEYSELDFDQSTTNSSKPVRRRRKHQQPLKIITDIELKVAYDHPLPISKALYGDLQSLCTSQAIPRNYHDFYNSLTHADSVEDDYNE